MQSGVMTGSSRSEVLEHRAGMAKQDDEAAVRADAASAVEELRQADAHLRRRRQASSGPREIDRRAFRLIAAAHDEGNPLSAKELSRALEISTASTTILLDRLTEAGLVQRRPHPRDRRAITIHPTGRPIDLGDSLTTRIAEVTEELDADEATVVARFLRRVTGVLDSEAR